MDSKYVDTINTAFWEEINKSALAMHPSQIKKHINQYLLKNIGIELNITALDLDYHGPRVGVYSNKQFIGVFNYADNCFEGILVSLGGGK